MPYNPINFSGANDMSTGVPSYGDLVSHLLEGYKAGAYPAEQKQKYRGEEENILKTALANELTKIYGKQKEEAGIKNTLAQALYHNAGANKLKMDYDPEAFVKYAQGLQSGLENKNPSNNRNNVDQNASENEPGTNVNAPGTKSALTFENYLSMAPEARKDMYESSVVSPETKQAIEHYEKILKNPQYSQVMNGLNNAVQNAETPKAVEQNIPSNNLAEQIIKHKLGIPLESPEEKEERAVNTATRKAEEIDSRKQRDAFEKEAPKVKSLINQYDKAIDILTKHPEYNTPLGEWGAILNSRAHNSEESGTLDSILGKLIGVQAQDFSSRVLASGLALATKTKASRGDPNMSAIGKLKEGREVLQETLKAGHDFYQKKGGKNVELPSANEPHINKDPLGLGL